MAPFGIKTTLDYRQKNWEYARPQKVNIFSNYGNNIEHFFFTFLPNNLVWFCTKIPIFSQITTIIQSTFLSFVADNLVHF